MIWREIISEKIRKQSTFLKYIKKNDEAKLLDSYLSNIEPLDSTNREGHAAKVYFNALFGKEFTRTEESALNAALNYGYSIILSLFTREIVANGYITQIGLFHDNMFNQFNLACDLMEPFRPIVDRFVLTLMPEVFEKEEKHEVITLLEESLIIDGRKEKLGQAVKIYTRSVFDALNDQDVSLLKFYML